MDSVRRALVRVLTAGAVAALSGCYDETGVTRYEPGEYKGASDPLRKMQGTPQQAQRLEERLRLVQADR